MESPESQASDGRDRLDTHNARVEFGKHAGELVTRVPVSYLRWASGARVNALVTLKDGRSLPFHEVAQAEMSRRGERLQDVDVSSHAIDRLSQRFLAVWQEHRKPDEGLMTWAQRMTDTLYRQYKTSAVLVTAEEEAQVTIEHLGIRWVIQKDLAVPVLLTCK